MALRLFSLVVALGVAASCGSDSPAAPTQPPLPVVEQTRIVAITGDLDFGDVQLFSEAQRTVTIHNQGNAAMSVWSLSGPNFRSETIDSPPVAFQLSWTNGSIAAGGSQSVTVRFWPVERRSYGGSLVVNGNHTSGINTRPILASGVIRTPLTNGFGPGQFRVNSEIVAGRYVSYPNSGCSWERQQGFSSDPSDIIASDFLFGRFDQAIVDVLSSDAVFESADCNSWQTGPEIGHQAAISPGAWLVGSQVTAGTYTSNVQDGCYWERVRNFQGTVSAVIVNDFVGTGGPRSVTIRASDVGFYTQEECGTWTNTAPGRAVDQSVDDWPSATVEDNWSQARVRRGGSRLR